MSSDLGQRLRVEVNDIGNDVVKSSKIRAEQTKSFFNEVIEECLPDHRKFTKSFWKSSASYLLQWIHVPFLPPLHRPGWLVRYAVGPFDGEWFESIFADIWAGITVALTLIPQALSYAQLANLPPINGLYCAVIPSATYSFFGSSMPLAVGPVAVVSLLTGSLVAQYVPDYATNTTEALNVAAQAALCCGIILTVLSFLNLGDFIRYVSHPVMSGFTSAAACIIGLNQLKGAFGFSSSVPQAGQEGYDYNFQVMRWFHENWNAILHYTPTQLLKPKYQLMEGHSVRNKYATQISLCTYFVLICIILLKNGFPSNANRKKSIIYRVWNIMSSLGPFLAIIICARMAYLIKKDDHFTDASFHYSHDYDAYTLKVVGNISPGLNFLRIPTFNHPMGKMLLDTIPLTLVAFMESYSVARKIASQRDELHILNASQEMFANGASNLLASICSAYPVSGSFSRSSLNAASGAKTPLSKVTTMLVVIIVLTCLTGELYYIPSAALSAVIWASIYNLISVQDFWHAWKYSKKDFITMLVTFAVVFIWDTGYGLACGIGCSVLMLLYDIAFDPNNQPIVLQQAKDNEGVDVIRIVGDITFITSRKFKDCLAPFINTPPEMPSETDSWSDRLFHTITTKMDQLYAIQEPKFVDKLPIKIILDFEFVRIIDLTGLLAIGECVKEAKSKHVDIVIVNPIHNLKELLCKYGLIVIGPEIADVELLKEKEDLDRLEEGLKLNVSRAKEYQLVSLHSSDLEKNEDESSSSSPSPASSKPTDYCSVATHISDSESTV